MKANELRIGNLVQYPYASPFYTIEDGIDIDASEIYQPIPLTEEWLLKFGFREVKYRNEEMIVYRKKLTSRKTNFDIIMGTHSCIFGMEFLCFTFYIHQLQNLFFALTGDELEIKLDK